MTTNNETRGNIGIYIYKEAEVLDFAGPFEVFSTANRISSHYQFNPLLIAENEDMVLARGGFKVLPDYTIKNHPPLEVLMIVGGDHHIDILNQTVIQWLQQQSDKVAWITSICTGIFFLAEAAIVKHQSVTTHFEDIPQLQAQYPDLSVLSNKRWVRNGNIITSAGISAGIDMSLYLLSLLGSIDIATQTAKQMEYDWQNRT